MWKTLKYLYKNNNDQRKLALKHKLWKIKCEKGNTISIYLKKLTTYRDELGSVGIWTTDDDMVSLALVGLPKRWHSYQDSANGREKLPDWEQLWTDLMQEEIRRSTRDGSSSKEALVMGHYATNCPQKKSKKGSSKGFDGEALASQFELDFSLIACIVSSMVGYVWYLDNRASFHMSGDKNLFSTLEEKDLQMRIKMGNDGKYHISGEGMVLFQREHGDPLTLTDVKYVPGLKKNLVSVAMLDDKGYDVVFSK
eukprot:PITA_25360